MNNLEKQSRRHRVCPEVGLALILSFACLLLHPGKMLKFHVVIFQTIIELKCRHKIQSQMHYVLPDNDEVD